MRKLRVFMVLVALFTTLSLIAQPASGGQAGRGGEGGNRPQRGDMANMTPEQRATRSVEMLNRILDLDSAQMDLIYNINIKNSGPLPSSLPKEEVDELSRKERKAYQDKLKEEKEQRDADFQVAIYNVLTPPQIEQYEAWTKKMKERMQGGQGGGQGGGQRGQGGMGGGRM